MRLPPLFLRIFNALFCAVFLLEAASVGWSVEPISPQGEAILQKLESMGVDRLWIAGAIVDWKTGEPTGKPVSDSGKHTHCSQFAAAACERLGVYLLRPPEHSPVLLANAQFDWLGDRRGAEAGWIPVQNGVEAQNAANRGLLVVAVCKNPDPKKPGHIAVVRCGDKNEDLIAKEGPDIIQAGGKNYVRVSMRKGFANHPNEYDGIRFFAHGVN